MCGVRGYRNKSEVDQADMTTVIDQDIGLWEERVRRQERLCLGLKTYALEVAMYNLLIVHVYQSLGNFCKLIETTISQ